MESGHKGLTVEELEILKHLLPCERSEARWKNHFYMLDRIFYSLRRAFRDAIGQGSVVPLRPTSSATLVGTCGLSQGSVVSFTTYLKRNIGWYKDGEWFTVPVSLQRANEDIGEAVVGLRDLVRTRMIDCSTVHLHCGPMGNGNT